MSLSRISRSITLELYILEAMCLAENSQIWTMSHFSPVLFTSWLNWEHRLESLSISIGSIMYATYTMEKGVSLIVEWGVVWYDRKISWSNSAHNPLASSSFFLTPFRITLFTDYASLLACRWNIGTNFVWISNLQKKSVIMVLANWVSLLETMMLESSNLHMIFCQ